MSHILLHCPFAVDVWNAIVRDFGLTWVMSPDLPSVLSSWQTLALNPKGKQIWQVAPTTVCWSIWREHNNRVFENAT